MLRFRPRWIVSAIGALMASGVVTGAATGHRGFQAAGPAQQQSALAADLSQQPSALAQPHTDKIVLDVVVSAKSGEPVGGLQQQDFTVLDNKVPQALASFEAVDGRKASTEVILLIDSVNVDYTTVSFERDQVDKLLRADRGGLAHPTMLGFLTDTGLEIQNAFSTDGEALSASLDRYTVALRSVRRNGGFWGANERVQVSLDGLHALVEREASRPGRKLILCLSSGWPFQSWPRAQLDSKAQERAFSKIVDFSTLLRHGRITLYSIDPLGASEAGTLYVSYWENFVKGVSKPSQVQIGDLSLQVLAVQSGGIVVNASNDVTALIQKCLLDTSVYYELSFDPPADGQPREYHHLEIRMAKPGLTARTRQGYYSQP